MTPRPRRTCLVIVSITFSKLAIFMSLIAPLTSVTDVPRTLFLRTWSEDMQGPSIVTILGATPTSVHLCHEETRNQPPPSESFSSLPALITGNGWTQQLTFQFSSDRIRRQCSPHAVWIQFLGSDPDLFLSVFHWGGWGGKWGATSEKEELQDCAYSSYDTFTHTHTHKKEKKKFLSTWMNIFFQTSVLSYIVCFYIKRIYEDKPQWWHFTNRSCVGKFNSDGNFSFFFFLFPVYMLMLSHHYLIEQLCSSSWVVWDCPIFISCIFIKASSTQLLLDSVLTVMKYKKPTRRAPPHPSPYVDGSLCTTPWW